MKYWDCLGFAEVRDSEEWTRLARQLLQEEPLAQRRNAYIHPETEPDQKAREQRWYDNVTLGNIRVEGKISRELPSRPAAAYL